MMDKPTLEYATEKAMKALKGSSGTICIYSKHDRWAIEACYLLVNNGLLTGPEEIDIDSQSTTWVFRPTKKMKVLMKLEGL